MKLVRALAAATVAAALYAAPGAQAQEPLHSRSTIDFRVVVPAFVRVSAVEHPHALEVTALDVLRGYVDVEQGSSVRVTSNARAGFTAAATFAREVLTGVEVRMPRPAGILVDAQVRIGYRLHLNPEMGPGTYRWPVALTFGAHSA